VKELKVNTNLDTLSEAWIILDDLGLSGLLTNAAANIKYAELANALLRGKKLHEFVACISGESIESVGKLSLKDAIEVITRFFVDMGSELSLLRGLGMQAAPTMESTPAGTASCAPIPSGE
jgi:hypothetical protein